MSIHSIHDKFFCVRLAGTSCKLHHLKFQKVLNATVPGKLERPAWMTAGRGVMLDKVCWQGRSSLPDNRMISS
jgi:hypothetical protein